MGITYRLKPEIKDFILAEKKIKQALSCRLMSLLIAEKFKIKVSKSSINTVFKQAGLSMPVGRRQKKKHRRIIFPDLPILEFNPVSPTEELKLPSEKSALPAPAIAAEPPVKAQGLRIRVEDKGVVFLKAADYLIGGSLFIAEVIKKYRNKPEEELYAKIEDLIYQPLLGESQDLLSYLNDLQGLTAIAPEIHQVILRQARLVRAVQVCFKDGKVLYLDGQLRTFWPNGEIPEAFSATLWNTKSCITNYLQEARPFVFLSAPGKEHPSLEFFHFLKAKPREILKLCLLDKQGEEIEAISLEANQELSFIFGLWPWQYAQQRKIKKISPFQPYHFRQLPEELFLAETELELLQPILKQQVTLKGLALKRAPAEKVCLVLLHNLRESDAVTEGIARSYLNRWPNFAESLLDQQRKIAFFTYSALRRNPFLINELERKAARQTELKPILEFYLQLLDTYVRGYFLPAKYQKWDFSAMKKHFYSLPISLAKVEKSLRISFPLPGESSLAQDLAYACQRMNEREILSPEKEKIWFTLS